jgi:hypothetical protein
MGGTPARTGPNWRLVNLRVMNFFIPLFHDLGEEGKILAVELADPTTTVMWNTHGINGTA